VNNYIKNYKNFLYEQDMAMPGMDPMADPNAQPAPTKKNSIYEFIFLEDGKKISSVGPLQKEYALYKIKESSLDDWIKTNIAKDMPGLHEEMPSSIDTIKTDIKNAVTGEKSSLSHLDKEILKKFKNSVKAGVIEGTDAIEKGNTLETIIVEFTKKGIPVTADIAPTFLDTRSSKK
jgi:hypothetical protein